tara:strand:+ start:865 stop:993 length:129 start_codon:yes stop_codon:yes gene_type:complete
MNCCLLLLLVLWVIIIAFILHTRGRKRIINEQIRMDTWKKKV